MKQRTLQLMQLLLLIMACRLQQKKSGKLLVIFPCISPLFLYIVFYHISISVRVGNKNQFEKKSITPGSKEGPSFLCQILSLLFFLRNKQLLDFYFFRIFVLF